MNRDSLIFTICLIVVALSASCLIYKILENDQKAPEELSEVCEAVNYRLVTIRGHHHCLPFMPEQEAE